MSIGAWLRSLASKPVRDRPAPAGITTEVARLEALADASYDAMYDAARHNVKDQFEDAHMSLSGAISLAEANGLANTAQRLRKRLEHIRNVYNHQFRYA